MDGKMDKIVAIILIILVIMVGAMIYLVESTSQEEETTIISIQDLASKLKNEGEFDDLLETTSKEIILQEYELEENMIQDLVTYQGSGASAEEILIIEAKNSQNVSDIKTQIEKHLLEKEEAYANYLPDEVEKIQDKVLKIDNNYVILCISKNSDKIEEIIKEYMQGR